MDSSQILLRYYHLWGLNNYAPGLIAWGSLATYQSYQCTSVWLKAHISNISNEHMSRFSRVFMTTCRRLWPSGNGGGTDQLPLPRDAEVTAEKRAQAWVLLASRRRCVDRHLGPRQVKPKLLDQKRWTKLKHKIDPGTRSAGSHLG